MVIDHIDHLLSSHWPKLTGQKGMTLGARDWHPNKTMTSFSNKLATLELQVVMEGSALKLVPTLINRSDKPLRISSAKISLGSAVIDFLGHKQKHGRTGKELKWFDQGWQSWSPTMAYSVGSVPLRSWLSMTNRMSYNLNNLPSNVPGQLSSTMYTMVANVKYGPLLLIGQVAFNQFVYFKGHFGLGEQSIDVVWDLGDYQLAARNSIALDPIVIATSGRIVSTKDTEDAEGAKCGEDYESDEVGLQKWYMDLIKPKRDFLPIKGWCSWYWKEDKVTQADVQAASDALKGQDVLIQLDDGYETAVGDWKSQNSKFPDLEEMVNHIKANGQRAGIWYAPFIVERGSALAKNHPDWLVRNRLGFPVVAGFVPNWKSWFYYALDVSQPEVLEYVRSVTDYLVNHIGMQMLKIDFAYSPIMKPKLLKYKEKTSAQYFRDALQVIRTTAGDHTTLLGCGMPLTPAIGIVDAMRVGIDTAKVWRTWYDRFLNTDSTMGVRNNSRNTLTRLVMNNRLWLNDPDCFFKDAPKLTESERELDNVVKNLGGVNLVSVDPAELVDGLGSNQAIVTETFSTIDLLDLMSPSTKELPSTVHLKGAHGECLLVINLTEDAILEPLWWDLHNLGYPTSHMWGEDHAKHNVVVPKRSQKLIPLTE